MTSPLLPSPLLPTSPFEPISGLPDDMFLGSAKDYLTRLEPPVRKVVGTVLLRLLAAQRSASLDNGEALKVLAALERDVLFVMGNLGPEKQTVWVDELKP